MKTASKPNKTANPIITTVLVRTTEFPKLDATHFSVAELVADIGCREVLKDMTESGFSIYAEEWLNPYSLCVVYLLIPLDRIECTRK
jgi:hypothetical protein